MTWIIGLTAGLIVPFAGIYYWQAHALERLSTSLQATVTDTYYKHVEQRTEALRAATHQFEGHPEITRALAAGDRGALLAQSNALFIKLRREQHITHLYFHRPNGQNLLRVHLPSRHGDQIRRFTMEEAMRTGKPASGVELGPLGTLTLHLVTPWFSEGPEPVLVGYVELGSEVDALFTSMEHTMDAQTFMLIRKELLVRASWESGMRTLNREPDWDRFPHFVSTRPSNMLPNGLVRFLKKKSWITLGNDTTILEKGRDFLAVFTPLKGMKGRIVGNLVLLVDTTRQRAFMRQVTWYGGVVLLLVFMALALFRVKKGLEID
ncbi:MAG: cache domain-containing protein [Leptospirillia bacterium]